jgi:hypothetical protein
MLPLAAVPVLVVLLVLFMLLLRDSAAWRAECSCSTICCCLRQNSSWSFSELELRGTPVLTTCLLLLAPAVADTVVSSDCCCRVCACSA